MNSNVDKDDQKIVSIFSGNLEQVPDLSSPLIRIFFSSTFTGIIIYPFLFSKIKTNLKQTNLGFVVKI